MRYTILAVIVILVGCATNSGPAPFAAPDAALDATPEQVWQALTMVYTDIGIPIENMDRASWFMRSDAMVNGAGPENAELFDCGETQFMVVGAEPLAPKVTVTANITTLLVPDGSRTRVRNRVNARTHTGLDCQSKGVLERRIVDALRERLQ